MPKCKRLGALLGTLLTLLGNTKASPKCAQRYLGTLQWTCLLNRPLLSTLNRVYEFAERTPCNQVQQMPRDVLDELSLCMSLVPCMYVDLARPWASNLVASDGAIVHGFGMAKARCSPDWSRRIAAHSSLDGHGIIPDGVDLNAPSVKAVAQPLHIPINYTDFVPQFSVKARHAGDAAEMEAAALTLTWRRITRSGRSHGRRWVCLVDAMALLYAARKGRTSSPAFKMPLQKIAALLMCADITATYAYVPTSCNPGDPPSRGIRRSAPHLRTSKPEVDLWTTRLNKLRRSLRHLRKSPVRGLPLSLRDKGSFDSMSSDSITTQP